MERRRELAKVKTRTSPKFRELNKKLNKGVKKERLQKQEKQMTEVEYEY